MRVVEKTSTGFCCGSSAVIPLEVTYDCIRRRPARQKSNMSGEDVCWASVLPEVRAVNRLLTECVDLNDLLLDVRTRRIGLESLIPEGVVSLMPLTVPLLPLPLPVSSCDPESLRNTQRILSNYISQVRIIIDRTLEDIQVLKAELNRLSLNTKR